MRAIANRPAYSALVVGVLGAGLACMIFMLVMVNAFLIRPLPFPAPNELLQAGIGGDGELGDIFPVADQDLLQIRAHLNGFADVAGVARSTINLSDLDRPERYNGGHASANLFHVLGVAPLLGRDFSADDERPGAPVVVMLSYALWQSRYGGDPAVVGRSLRIDARPATVIGVMPKDFSYPRREALWVASTLVQADKPDEYHYWIVLRRHPGVGDAAVATAFDGWFADAARADPENFRGRSVRVEPLAKMVMDRSTRSMLGLMFAAGVFVLLIACANVANLLLTRTLGRRHELAVRVALGASRKRLVVHMFAQSLILSVLATVLALGLARAGVVWQQAASRESEFALLWLQFDFDGSVLLCSFAAMLLTAFASGALPALQAASGGVANGLRDEGRSVAGGLFARVSRVLVVGEVALSCALLICVGTLVHGILALQRVDLGIDTQHLLTARILLPANTYPGGDDQLRVYQRIGERLRAEPGVVDATVGTALPGTYYNEVHDVVPTGATVTDSELPQIRYAAVDAHFLGAYGVHLQEGRFFDDSDGNEINRVAVVDRRFADRFGKDQPLLGRQFRLDPRDPQSVAVTVIGVIGTLNLNTPGDDQPLASMLVPLRQAPFKIASIAVRTRGDALAFAPRLNEIMREIDGDTPLYWVRDYAAVIRSMSSGERMVAQSFGIFGLIALTLAGAGLYGITAFIVGQRTREIGVRRALGAPGAQVLRGLFARTLWQLGIGLALGLSAGIAFAHLLSRSLQTIPASNASTIAGAVLVLTVAAGLAVIVPARRALRVDPVVALRSD
jgi:predicted permease